MWRAAADKGETKRITWVCGNQPVLVEEVVDTVRAALKPSDLDYHSFAAGSDPDRDIWAAANQHPLQPGANRLVLIRRAEKIASWGSLETWLAGTRHLPTTYLVFVAAEDDFPYRYVDGKRAGLKPHVELIKARGRIVRCAPPNEADAVAWVRRRAPLDPDMARYLLQRSGGNLSTVAAACAKIALFNTSPGTGAIDALCAEAPNDTFVDSLLAMRKRDALLAADSLPERDYTKTIALLDTRLDLLASLWRATRAGLSAREVQGHPPFLVRQYMPVAKLYEPRRCEYARRVLAVLDNALRSGARTGVIEALVALW